MPRVLMLNTGGTLGMRPREPDRALAPDEIGATILENLPELTRIAEIETKALFNIDSTDITSFHWMQLAHAIADSIDAFDGVVITHGTDAMAYTAAALSFLLRGLAKPVILTGSQRPLVDVRSDGRANLIGAVDVACRGIPEVCIYADGKLLRGNRTKKTSSFAYEAFSSPNFPPLAELGASFQLITASQVPGESFEVRGTFDERVAAVRLIPGASSRLIESLDPGELRGLVVQAFGVGNLPRTPDTVRESLRALIDAGVVVAIASQSSHGRVDLEQYAGGRLAREIGALGTADMTIESTCVKLMYLLGTLKEPKAVCDAMLVPIAGELTA